MRLHTYIKNYANLTKSELMEKYQNNMILVNGTIQKLSYEVNENDVITLDGKIINRFANKYYLYNKEIGIICTNNKTLKESIISKINTCEKVYPVGRLDKESSGLLILTNDGKLCNYLKSKKVEKQYYVTVKDKITKEFLEKLLKPYILRGKVAQIIKADYIDDYHFSCILNEGMYHEIRRIVILSGNRVLGLLRNKIGDISLDDLQNQTIREVSLDFINKRL